MAKKLNENDYVFISARIHALELKMLTRERMERMLEARTVDEAAKVLGECGYEDFPSLSPSGIEETLNKARLALFADLRKSVPNPALVDVFCIKYDYHNAKVLLKATAMGTSPKNLFIDAGRYPVVELEADFQKEELIHCSQPFQEAVAEAQAVLASSHDPQAADLILDRAYYEEFLAAAKAVGSSFLEGYVRLSLDAANLRSLVRAHRMGRGTDFLKRVLMAGGSLPVDKLLTLTQEGADLVAPFSATFLKSAAEAGKEVLGGGTLTQFERLCDDALTQYLKLGKQKAFGEYTLLGYLYAKEAELTTIRIILTGRLAGLDSDIIRERLRESYV